MTHDELLIQMQYDRPWEYIKYQEALRVVVELHKPRETSFGVVCCETCSEKIFRAYPCSTIQAIEKELQ